jgi:hypothetical protein
MPRFSLPVTLIAVALSALPATAAPRPVPQLGPLCPNGYSASAGARCVPNLATRCHAFVKTDPFCRAGYVPSGGGAYCLETGCDSGARR